MDMQAGTAVRSFGSRSFRARGLLRLRKAVRKWQRPLLLAGGPLLLAIAGIAYYLAGEPYVSTDDAFIRAAKETVNARVAGQVIEIAVHDNQRVQAGQLLLRIDPRPYQIAVARAEARLASTRLQVGALKATYRQQLAELQSAKESAVFDAQQYKNRKGLYASAYIAKEDYQRAQTALMVARQNIVSIEQQIAKTVTTLNGDPNVDVNSHPMVREAKADLDQARLDLSYAVVRAADDGVVTKVDDLQVGDYVHPGAAIFALMSSRRLWIEANFRETDLTHMHPGQPASISVDAYPGRVFKAHVASLSPGTGSDFSVLPPENATGNWVKVIQRLPVRLELDDAAERRQLYSGLSVTARVDTGYRGWLMRLLGAADGAK